MPLENWIGWSLTRSAYALAVFAISLSEAKNIAIGLVVVFVLGSVAAAWLMKTIIQKFFTAAVLVVFAFGVWTQRTSLEDCADKVRDVYALDRLADDPGGVALDTDCSFFGTTITIPDARDGVPTVPTGTTG